MPQDRTVTLWVYAALFLTAVGSVSAVEPFGVPRSNRVIVGEVRLPPGEVPARPGEAPKGFTARFEIRDGTLLTIENRHKDRNYFLGFSGTMNPETENPNIVPWRFDRSPSVGDSVAVTEIGRSKEFNSEGPSPLRDLPIGHARIFRGARNIRIKIIDVKERVFAVPPLSEVDLSSIPFEELEQDFGFFGNGGCCVSCQGVAVCGGSVQTSCGGCDGGGGGALAY